MGDEVRGVLASSAYVIWAGVHAMRPEREWGVNVSLPRKAFGRAAKPKGDN